MSSPPRPLVAHAATPGPLGTPLGKGAANAEKENAPSPYGANQSRVEEGEPSDAPATSSTPLSVGWLPYLNYR